MQHWFNLFSSRYMAGRVSRAPGEDESSLLQALEAIKGEVAEPAAEQGEAALV
ncbi:hypothetical protein D3C79_1094810 [compost metagenome]